MAKEWSETLEELGKKKQNLEGLLEKIVALDIQLDTQTETERDLQGAAYVYDEEHHKRHLEWIEQKIAYIGYLAQDGGGSVWGEAEEQRIAVIIPDQQFRKQDEHSDGRRPEHRSTGRFTVDEFEYDEGENRYQCPAWKRLVYKGQVQLNRNRGEQYQGKSSDSKGCSL
jgi:hypothetical protein